MKPDAKAEEVKAEAKTDAKAEEAKADQGCLKTIGISGNFWCYDTVVSAPNANRYAGVRVFPPP